jgi:lipid-binding SYLF domain-containing protein
MRIRSTVLAALFVAFGVVTPAWAQTPATADSDEAKRITESITVLRELSGAPDRQIPEHLLARAEAIVVIPTLIKGGFVIGAKHGKGIISTRDRATNTWSNPAFVTMTGGSIGWQIGVESVDLVLLVMNRRGVDDLLEDRFTLGGSLSVAAGPVGRSGEASTNAQVSAQILAYSRSKGLFAGATLEGAGLRQDNDANKRMYNVSSLRDVLAGKGGPTAPAAAAAWRSAVKSLIPSEPNP